MCGLPMAKSIAKTDGSLVLLWLQSGGNVGLVLAKQSSEFEEDRASQSARRVREAARRLTMIEARIDFCVGSCPL